MKTSITIQGKLITGMLTAIVVLFASTELMAQKTYSYDENVDVIESEFHNAPFYKGEIFPENNSLTYNFDTSEAFYEEIYFLPGFDGNILSSVEHDGELYISGWFTRDNGGVSLNGVAKWNGSEWEPVGEGFTLGETGIASINVLSSINGELYAGGNFTQSGSNEVNMIAKWNGTEWQNIGQGFNSGVNAIKEYNGNIYAGGLFTESGGETVSRIAMWDGTEWVEVVRGLNNTVQSLAVWDGNLVAGGSFTAEPDMPVDQGLFTGMYSIEQQTESEDFGPPLAGDENFELELLIDHNNPVNGRRFIVKPYEHFGFENDTEFRLVFSIEENSVTLHDVTLSGVGCSGVTLAFAPDANPDNSFFDPNDDSSFQMAFIENILEACGFGATNHTFLATKDESSKQISANESDHFNGIAIYDGSEWSDLNGGFVELGSVNELEVFNGTLYAGGIFLESMSGPVNNIAAWNGSEWNQVGDGFNGNVHSLATDGSTLYASGTFSESGSNLLNRLAAWTGSSWEAVGASDQVTAIFNTTIFDNNLFVSHGSFNAGDIVRPAMLDNGSWNFLGVLDDTGAGVSGQIAGLTKDGATIYAAGNFLRAGMVPAERTAMWTPQNGWQQMGSGLNNFVRRLTVFDGNVIAGGNFTANGAGDPISRIAMFDGTDWSEMGGGLNATIQRLLEYNGQLIVAGNFINSGPNEVTGVTSFSNDEWQKMGEEIVGPGYGLAELDGDLYLSGFNLMGDNEKVAVWDGTVWIALPSTGFPASVNNVWSLGVHDNMLYAAAEHFENDEILNGIFKFENDEWTQIGDNISGDPIFDIISHDDHLYVGGFFDTVGDESMRSPIYWNGTEWESAGGGINGVMHSFVSTPRGLFIGGSYQTAGNVPSRSLAKWITDEEAVSIDESFAGLPKQVRLNQNYPNPFNPATTISFDLPSASDVRLDIYDLLGRRVATLVNDHISAGSHEVRFDASALSSGLFIYRLNTADAVITRNMMLIK